MRKMAEARRGAGGDKQRKMLIRTGTKMGGGWFPGSQKTSENLVLQDLPVPLVCSRMKPGEWRWMPPRTVFPPVGKPVVSVSVRGDQAAVTELRPWAPEAGEDGVLQTQELEP